MLAVLDGWAALVRLPTDFLPVATHLPALSAIDLLPAAFGGVPLGMALVWVWIRYLRWRRRRLPGTLFAPAPLAAREPRELWPATLTALAAGVTEELAFRLTVPLLIARLTGSPWAGFAVATAAFVALHR